MLRTLLRRAATIDDVHPRAMLLEPWRAVYLPIPKVACTSMKALFANELESRYGRPLRRRADGTTLFPAIRKTVLYNRRLYPYLYGGYCTFSLVRNPYHRVLSFYKNKIESADPAEVKRFRRFEAGASFRRCVEIIAATPDADASHHFRSQAAYLVDRSGRFMPDLVGKFETIDTDVDHIARRIGMAAGRLDRLNASGSADLERYFDDTILRMIEKRYARDFDLLGYQRLS